jgi:ferredoxin-NADP reductase
MPFVLQPSHKPYITNGKLISAAVVNESQCILIDIAVGAPCDYVHGQHVVLLHDTGQDILFVFASPSSITDDKCTIQLALRHSGWPPICNILPDMPAGSILQIDGGHGDMRLPSTEEMVAMRLTDIFMIGAGTGFACMMCMIRYLTDHIQPVGLHITAIYMWNIGKARTPLFHEELSNLHQSERITLRYGLTGASEVDKVRWAQNAIVPVVFRRIDEEVRKHNCCSYSSKI